MRLTSYITDKSYIINIGLFREVPNMERLKEDIAQDKKEQRLAEKRAFVDDLLKQPNKDRYVINAKRHLEESKTRLVNEGLCILV